MMTRRWHAMAAGLALLLTAACNRTPEADPARAEDYRLTLPVTPAPGAPVQRLVLPAAALSAIQRADMGDIRVLDGANRPLSIALLPGGAAKGTAAMTSCVPCSTSPPAGTTSREGCAAGAVKARPAVRLTPLTPFQLARR